MDKLSEELDILLNHFEKIIPEEVGSFNTTDDSSFNIDNIRPEDSISNSGNKIKDYDYEIYNIDGQIKILNGKVLDININPKGKIKKILENYNKELKIYNELKEEFETKINNIDNKEYQSIISKYEKEKERIIELNKLENEKEHLLILTNKKAQTKGVEGELETKQYKKQIEEIIQPEENINFRSDKHYTKLNENLIQCNYCSKKPYDICKTKNYIINHLLNNHNISVDKSEII